MEKVCTLTGHTARVWCVKWGSSGLASCGEDKSIRLWKRDQKSQEMQLDSDHNMQLESQINVLGISHNQKYEENMHETDQQNVIQDGYQMKIDQKIQKHSYSCRIIADAHTRTVRCIAFCDQILASASFDGGVALWDLTNNPIECEATLEGHENEVKAVAWHGNLLATCARDRTVWVWEACEDGDWECVAVLSGHNDDVKHVAWHPTEELLASASYDCDIRFWKEEQGDWCCVQTLNVHSSTVWALAFNHNGSHLVSVGDDCRLVVCVLAQNGYQMHSEINLTGTLYSVAWAGPTPRHEAGLIATCGADNKISIISFDSDTLAVIRTESEAHGKNDINCVAWSQCIPPLLASCGDDCNVNIWAVEL